MPFLRTRFLEDSSPEFQTLIKSLRSGYFFCNVKDQICHISFAIKHSAKLVHQSRCQYNITISMRQEIEFFHEKSLPTSDICWESPITHVIPRMPTFTAFGDSCLKGASGYSLSLGFWWHLPFPEEVKLRTLLHKSFVRGSGGKNVIFSNGPNFTSECSKLLY
jgi:hypothetical protein